MLDEILFFRRDGVTKIGLCQTIESILAVQIELRDGDGGENSNDCHHGEQLDQSKASLSLSGASRWWMFRSTIGILSGVVQGYISFGYLSLQQGAYQPDNGVVK